MLPTTSLSYRSRGERRAAGWDQGRRDSVVWSRPRADEGRVGVEIQEREREAVGDGSHNDKQSSIFFF
jgi:hypothetical protein